MKNLRFSFLMPSLAVIANLLAAAPTYAANGDFVGCWDGTFAYNTTNILQVADGFEVSLKGSTLRGDAIKTVDGFEFRLQGEAEEFIWHTGLGVYIKFPAGACQIDVQAQTAHCQAQLAEPVRYRSAFVTWQQLDIDFNGRTSAPIVHMGFDNDLVAISYDVSTQGAQAAFTTQARDGSQSISRVTIVRGDFGEDPGLRCNLSSDITNGFLQASFPERLRAYLAQP